MESSQNTIEYGWLDFDRDTFSREEPEFDLSNIGRVRTAFPYIDENVFQVLYVISDTTVSEYKARRKLKEILNDDNQPTNSN